MKIIFLNDDFLPEKSGGAASVIFNLSQELIRLGHNVSVITTTFKSKRIITENYQDIKIYRLPVKKHGLLWRSYFSIYNPSTLKKIKKIFKQEKPDVIHAHSIYTHAISYAVLKLAHKFTCQVFFTAHDVMPFSYGKLMFSPEQIPQNFREETEYNYQVSWWKNFKRSSKAFNPFKKFFINYYLSFTKQIFAVSGALKKALQQNKIAQGKKIIVMHNGLNLNKWQIPSQEKITNFKKEYQLEDCPVIFFGGRLSMAKGILQALEVVQQIKNKFPQIKLLIVGQAEKFKTKIMPLIKEKNLLDNVIFTGWLSQKQMKNAYAVSDLILVPSICFDSFPTNNLEAMALQKPVLATCLGGSKEVIQHTQNGYIINPYLIEKNTQKMLNLLSQPELRQKIGQAALKTLQENFTIQKQTNQLLKFYK